MLNVLKLQRKPLKHEVPHLLPLQNNYIKLLIHFFHATTLLFIYHEKCLK